MAFSVKVTVVASPTIMAAPEATVVAAVVHGVVPPVVASAVVDTMAAFNGCCVTSLMLVPFPVITLVGNVKSRVL